MTRHKVFISFNHGNDLWYKRELLRINSIHNVFIDGSVNTGDIDDTLSNETIRTAIRDHYLKDTTVTILLVGTETKNRKYIDWELKSSMINGAINKKSGILVINLPSINCPYYHVSHEGEKEQVYPENKTWETVNTRAEFERRYPYMPARIIDNLLDPNARISVVNWSKISGNIELLRYLIDATHKDKVKCHYDLSRPMRRHNS